MVVLGCSLSFPGSDSPQNSWRKHSQSDQSKVNAARFRKLQRRTPENHRPLHHWNLSTSLFQGFYWEIGATSTPNIDVSECLSSTSSCWGSSSGHIGQIRSFSKLVCWGFPYLKKATGFEHIVRRIIHKQIISEKKLPQRKQKIEKCEASFPKHLCCRKQFH